MTAILKTWSVRGHRCILWLDEGTKYRACALVRGVPEACVELPRARGLEATASALAAALPAALRTYGMRVVTDDSPLADIAIMCGNHRPPEAQQITKTIQIAEDLQITPVRVDLIEMVSEACLSPGYNRLPAAADLRVFSYGFLRLSPPREPLGQWDSDSRLQKCIALSRLVHPTSISFQYSARLLGDPDDPDFEVRPGSVSGFGGSAWTALPERNWLTPTDADALKELFSAFELSPLDPASRLSGALWYHEYAARTELIDIRFPLIATALESLVSPDSSASTRSFTRRLPQLADRLGLAPLSADDAGTIWGRRSSLMHGAKHGGLSDDDFRLYVRMEEILRATIRRSIEDPAFRAIFASRKSVERDLPVPAPTARSATCPQCAHRFPL